MLIDKEAESPAFAKGKPPDEDMTEVLEWCRARLPLPPGHEWVLISATRKFGKTLFEIEDRGPDGSMRVIGKIGREERMRVTFEALTSLWNAGFCPPAEFTVTKPVAFLPERHLLLQEKAPGVELFAKFRAQAPDAAEATGKAAEWLARLHSATVPHQRWREPLELEKWISELSSVIPGSAARMERIGTAVRAELARRTPDIVPAHGDFHLLNIFIAEDGRVTAIDIDKFGGRDRAEEVGYSLCQTACICFHRLGSFEVSLPARRDFLRAYEAASGVTVPRKVAGAHMAATLLKNLHFDLYACKTGHIEIVDPWLQAAEHCLHGDLDIT
jgi:hypothetical protein